MEISKTKVYIYGILDESDQIIYIGKSSTPYARLSHHVNSGFSQCRRCKIIDIFYDTEFYYISKFLSEGVKLENKHTTPFVEKWEIGDIISIGKLKRIKCKNTKTEKIYQSIAEAARDFSVSRDFLLKILYSDNIPIEIKNQYPLEILND